MNSSEKYNPEDIESLLAAKSFEDLYPEEKEYVLKHMESQQEYEQMRTLMLQLDESNDEWAELEAPSSMRDSLLEMHEQKHSKTTFTIWLNSLFVGLSLNQSLFKTPAFQVGLVACCLIIGLFVINDQSAENAVAIAQEPAQEQDSKSISKPKSDEGAFETSREPNESETFKWANSDSEDQTTEQQNETNGDGAISGYFENGADSEIALSPEHTESIEEELDLAEKEIQEDSEVEKEELLLGSASGELNEQELKSVGLTENANDASDDLVQSEDYDEFVITPTPVDNATSDMVVTYTATDNTGIVADESAPAPPVVLESLDGNTGADRQRASKVVSSAEKLGDNSVRSRAVSSTVPDDYLINMLYTCK